MTAPREAVQAAELAKRLDNLARWCNGPDPVCLTHWPNDIDRWCETCVFQRASTVLAALAPASGTAAAERVTCVVSPIREEEDGTGPLKSTDLYVVARGIAVLVNIEVDGSSTFTMLVDGKLFKDGVITESAPSVPAPDIYAKVREVFTSRGRCQWHDTEHVEILSGPHAGAFFCALCAIEGRSTADGAIPASVPAPTAGETQRAAVKAGFFAGFAAARWGTAAEAWEKAEIRHAIDYPTSPPLAEPGREP